MASVDSMLNLPSPYMWSFATGIEGC